MILSPNFRITPQRELIINAITNAERHLSAEEIFQEVSKVTGASNLATVYRTLDLLFEEGLACRNDLGGGRVVFATTEHGHHIHLVCRQCGTVIDADSDYLQPIQDELKDHYQFDADLEHISLFGLCQGCQE